MENIKVVAFDTGGTVLDWHAGLTAAMTAWVPVRSCWVTVAQKLELQRQ